MKDEPKAKPLTSAQERQREIERLERDVEELRKLAGSVDGDVDAAS